MANTQEPFDLLAGIYTAGGRPDPNGKSYTLDQLVAAYGNEAKLRSFVFALAQRAADRNAGDATAAADMKVADAIMERCFPVILRAWRAKREELAAEHLDLADIVRAAAPRLRYQPVPAQCDAKSGKAVVTVAAVSSDSKFASHRDRMLEILKILYGPGCYISVTDRWQSGGKEGAAANEQIYTFDKDGVHTVGLEESIEVGGSSPPRTSPLVFKTTLTAEVEIAVQGGAKQPEVAFDKNLLNFLHKTTSIRFAVNGRIPGEWLDGRQDRPTKDIGNVGTNLSFGGPEHPLVWSGDTFSLAYKESRITDKIRGGPLRDKGYDQTATYDISVTGKIDLKTGMVLSVRGVSLYTLVYVPVNLPPKGPPVVVREVLEFRNLGPVRMEARDFAVANRNGITPGALKQHLVEMTNSVADLTFRWNPGTGDPKTCQVDLAVYFGR